MASLERQAIYRDAQCSLLMDLQEALWQDPERMSGALCFRNTRVPVSIFFEYLEAGRVDEFFKGYPGITREQTQAVIEASQWLIESEFRKSA